MLGPFYFRHHFGAIPPSNLQCALPRGVRTESNWQTPATHRMQQR